MILGSFPTVPVRVGAKLPGLSGFPEDTCNDVCRLSTRHKPFLHISYLKGLVLLLRDQVFCSIHQSADDALALDKGMMRCEVQILICVGRLTVYRGRQGSVSITVD